MTGPKYARGWTSAVLAAALALGLEGCQGRVKPSPPVKSRDVLLVTIDTLRADAVGAYGAPGSPTPWMDRLAAAGTRFDQAHAQAVLTLPSHASILSSRNPFGHGVRDNAGFRFPASIDTLP